MAEPVERFGGIQRLYGNAAMEIICGMHVLVVGIGGVGSWAVEALARTGVGHLTLIDDDEVAISNTNRQIHTLSSSIGQPKVSVMAERVAHINPDCRCDAVDDFLTVRNLHDYLSRGYDYVIDAIDSIKFKAAMINYCRRHEIPLVATGGAGGLTDPTQVQVADLSRTYNDPLASRVRAQLRREYGFPREPGRRFGVECVYSIQRPVYPKPNGTVCSEKPGIHGVSLDCRFGYGAASFVTATFGFVAASRALSKTLDRRHAA